MSDERRLGDIDLKDYLRLVHRKRPFRVVRAVAIAGACVVAFAAGALSPWSGKETANLTFDDALIILERVPNEEWEHELGVYALHDHLTRALDLLGRVARESEMSGNYASLSLRHLTRRALGIIAEQAIHGPYSSIHLRSLELIREDLPPR